MFPMHPHIQMLPLQPFIYPIPQMPIPMQIPLQPLPPLLPPLQPFQQLQPQPQPQPPLLPAPQPFIRHPVPVGQKTLYILSYSTEVLHRHPHAEAQISQHTPHGIPNLLTIYCHAWRAPSRETCERYSGVSPQVQAVILGSRTAVGDM
jgi:hypothetical protein